MKRRKKQAGKAEAGRKRQGRALDVICILLAFFALFSLAAMVSYDPADPSFASTSLPGDRVHNLGGKAGAWLAEGLMSAFGLAAYLFPFAMGFISIKSLVQGRKRQLAMLLLELVLLLLLLCPLLSLIFQSFTLKGERLEAGGLVGKLVYSLLYGQLNTAGSFIVLVLALALFLLFTTRWSPKKSVLFVGNAFDSKVKEVRIQVTENRKSRAREKMREKVLQKYAAPAGAEEQERRTRADLKREKAERKREEKERKKQEKEEMKRRKEAEAAEVRTQVQAAPKPAPPKEAAPKLEQKILFPDPRQRGDYLFPSTGLLEPGKPAEKIDKNELFDKKRRIEEKLREFGIDGEVREYHPGPVITTYEYFPAPGIKVSQVANMSEDLSLALEAESVRIHRIPGKSSLGIEIPNQKREIIKLRDILESEAFRTHPSKLTFALGKDVRGGISVTDLTIMPHLLIAGSTGTGKSVALNGLIASILYKATPDEVKLVLIDPKRLEFSLYEDIPHLLCPVINDPKKAHIILMDIVKKMEERYRKFQTAKVRNIEQYNQAMLQMAAEKKGKLTDEEKENFKPISYIVIIIDELAELMMVGSQEVEFFIGRLAQLARAVGIHLVLATQRPSIDVITGTIKNNFPSRIAFRVPSKVDSRVIIDTVGAEKLLGMGDLLFTPPNSGRIVRLHCAYISNSEVRRLVKHVKSQAAPEYDERISQIIKGGGEMPWEDDGEKDELYDKAVELVLTTGQASASFLQRRLKLGYARAARIIDQMEQEGIIGPSEGSKAREIMVDAKTYLKEMKKGPDQEEF